MEIDGNNASLTVLRQSSITAPDSENTAVQVNGNAARISNFGSISGALNGISSEGVRLRLFNGGTINSDSRAVDWGYDGLYSVTFTYSGAGTS